jgi:hypothetical protein
MGNNSRRYQPPPNPAFASPAYIANTYIPAPASIDPRTGRPASCTCPQRQARQRSAYAPQNSRQYPRYPPVPPQYI